MVGKFLSLFLLQIIFIVDFLHSQDGNLCSVQLNGIFNFKNQNEDTIKEYLNAFNFKVKQLVIQDCFIKSVKNIFSVIQDFTLFEELIIQNSGLESFDISNYPFLRLKTLKLDRNNLSRISFGSKSVLEILDLSFNNLSALVLTTSNVGRLKELNLFGNSFTSLQLNLNAIENINLSGSLSPNMSSVSITIWNKFNSLDLSRNGLLDIGFLKINEAVNVLDLRHNNIFSLRDLITLGQPKYHLQIYLSSNKLLCSPELSMDWLTLRNKNISFDEDLNCSFPQSKNKYPISKYGWMFSNESYILNEKWANTQLQAFLEFRSMGFRVLARTSGILVMWKNRKTINQEDLIQLKSREGLVVHSVKIKMNQTSGREFINYTKMPQISEVCFFLSVLNLTGVGLVNDHMNVQCTNLTSLYNMSTYDFRTLFIVFTVLLLLTCLTLLAYIGYIHKSKWQKKDSSNTNEIELKPKVEQQMPSNVTTTQFHNRSYMPSSDYLMSSSASASPSPTPQNHLKFHLKPKPNLYLSMERHESYRISKTDNVYDGMDSLSLNTRPVSIKINEKEDVYDYCE